MQALLKRVVPAAQVKHELAVLQRMQLEMDVGARAVSASSDRASSTS
jgi:hypothetical protein